MRKVFDMVPHDHDKLLAKVVRRILQALRKEEHIVARCKRFLCFLLLPLINNKISASALNLLDRSDALYQICVPRW